MALVYLAAASIAYCEGMQSIGGISGKYNASALRCTTLESSGSVPNARDAACVLAQTSARVRDTSAQQACQKTGRLRWDACDPLTCQCLQWTARCQRATQKGYFRRSYQFSTRPSGHIDGHWIRHATFNAEHSCEIVDGCELDAVHIQTVIKDFLAERFDISADKITDNTAIRDLGLDSMMMLEVMLELEDRLGIKLKDLSMPANPMLRDVVALVERNQSAQKR